MAERVIRCKLCTPETDWRVKPEWTADQAMAWFHGEHVLVHLADVMRGVTLLLGLSTPVCRPCRRANRLQAEHRPCFQVDCYCACSRPSTTTASERTAHADD